MNDSTPGNSYGLALANQIIGLLRNDPAYISRAGALFALHRDATTDAKEKRLADLGFEYSEYLFTGNYPKAVGEQSSIATVQYVKDRPPTGDFKKIILGRSVIRVNSDALVKTQVDRVTRDWVLAFHVKGEPWKLRSDDLFFSHEGARLTELFRFTGARIAPVWGSNSKCSKFLGFPNRRKNDSALEWSFCRLFFLV